MKSGKVIAGMLVIFYIFFSFGSFAEGAGKNTSAALSDQADQIVQYTDANQIQAAKAVLKNLEASWSAIKSMYSETDQRTIEIQLDQLGSVLTGSTSAGERPARALSLRLSLDALSAGNHDPLWTQMRDPVLSTIGAMESAMRKHDRAAFYDQRNQFLNQYAILYPALVISGSDDLLNRVDRLVSGLGKDGLTNRESLADLSKLRAEFRQLFHLQTMAIQGNRVPFIAFVIGVVLILSLAFVSWRRFSRGGSHWPRMTYR
ncbi:sporulation protein YpjB [Sporolactobacillus vineae]|uniref:sporulation protein YpjB n=1 Tax=Sporolactobacillus vineae TaxID=444463 RepID=UPI000288E4F9|nr:sporulation protein YpjB [Sporolactobacillus vineae]